MNTRIKELALQAGLLEILNEHAYEFGNGPGNNPELEKFSELIIEECIAVMVTHDYHGTWLGEQIKEHFRFDDSSYMICPKCGTDRSKAACPGGETATLTKQCPMVSESQ